MLTRNWLIAGAVLLGEILAAPAPAAPASAPASRIVSADGARETVLEFQFPAAQSGSDRVSASIGFPGDAEPRLEILEADLNPPLSAGRSSWPARVTSGSWLQELVRVDLDGFLGDQRVLMLTASGLLPPADEGDPPRRCRRLVVRISTDTEGADSGSVASNSVNAGGAGRRPLFEPVLRASLLNYERLERRLAPGAFHATTHRASAASGGVPPAIKVMVSRDGIHRVTPDDLSGAGIEPAALDPRRLCLTFKGQPVPVYVEGEEDGRFDPQDRLLFYGQAPTGFTASANVYWLSEGLQPGPRMATRSASPGAGAPDFADFSDAARAEQDNILVTNNSAADGDYYYWQILFNQADPNKADYELMVPDPAPAAAPATLRVALEGRVGTQHHARVYFNGAPTTAEAIWAGPESIELTAPVSPSLILDGSNIVRVEMVNDTGSNSIYVNRFDLEYRRRLRAPQGALWFALDPATTPIEIAALPSSVALLLDVSDPLQPQRLTGAQVIDEGGSFRLRVQDAASGDGGVYALTVPLEEIVPDSFVLDVPSNLHAPGEGADYIVISHTDFLPALEPLVAHRQAQGLRTALVDLTDVYDEFSDGIFDPEAIRDFVRHAYESWPAPAPTYLLLVGDANLDYQDRLRTGVRDFLPASIFLAPLFGLAPEDNRYVAVAGDDPLPDLFVGRLPVKTLTQAEGLVAKLLAYEQAGAVPEINSRVLHVADNDDPNFEGILEALVGNQLDPTGRTISRVYLRNYTSTSAARDAIVSQVNSGQGVVTYLGHGNIINWAGENLVTSGDVSRFTNTGRYPFFVALNCLNGFFAAPRPGVNDPALGEAFLTAADRGAVAFLAPSTLGSLSDYDLIADELYAELFRRGDLTLGGAATAAKVTAYLSRGAGSTNIPGIVFLGDPATPLALDSDADGALDYYEISAGTNPADTDSDDDGLPDGPEGTPGADADGDGLINPLDPDADNDGILDGTEAGIVAPGADTDLARGFFRPDSDPSRVTDPRNPDTDAGGAPDGAEDRDADGALDAGETDPLAPLDDPVCGGAAPPEMDGFPVYGLRTAVEGSDIVLRWSDARTIDPCVLYRVYATRNAFPKNSAQAFVAITLTGDNQFRHLGAAADGFAHDYLVTGVNLIWGEGPLGHYGR